MKRDSRFGAIILDVQQESVTASNLREWGRVILRHLEEFPWDMHPIVRPTVIEELRKLCDVGKEPAHSIVLSSDP